MIAFPIPPNKNVNYSVHYVLVLAWGGAADIGGCGVYCWRGGDDCSREKGIRAYGLIVGVVCRSRPIRLHMRQK